MAFAEVCEVRTAAKCYTPPNIVGGRFRIDGIGRNLVKSKSEMALYQAAVCGG